MDSNAPATIHISSRTIIEVILFLLLVALLFYLKELVLIVLTAIVIASAIEPAAKWFMKYRIPRIAAVLVVYLTVVGGLFALFYFFLPPVLNETANFLSTMPQYIDSITVANSSGNGVSSFLSTQEVVAQFSLRDVVVDLQRAISNVSGSLLKTVSTVFGGVLSFGLIIVFSFYFAVQDTGIDDFLRVVTPLRHQEYVVGLWRRSQHKIGRWMQGQLLLGLIVGVLVYLGLTILGVKYALLLAVLAAIFEIIPVFGPILAAIPAVGVALVDGGVTLGLLAAGLFVIIQQFENHLIYPLVVTKVVGVPPLLVILALIVGAQLAGFLGVILSVPVAAAIQEFVKDLEKQRAEIAHRASR